jgi:glucose/mannose transport system permease protein
MMLVNSVKPLAKITGGGMMNLPQKFTIEPQLMAWCLAQIGVEPTGLAPYFWNLIRLVLLAVVISMVLGALHGYVLTKRRFKRWNSPLKVLHPLGYISLYRRAKEWQANERNWKT